MIEKLSAEQIEQKMVVAGGNPSTAEKAAIIATLTSLIQQNQSLGPRQIIGTTDNWNRNLTMLRGAHNLGIRGWNSSK